MTPAVPERAFYWRTALMSATVMVVLAGCATPQKEPAVRAQVQCEPVAADEALLGNWLSVREQAGVVGKLHMQIVLSPDGTMAYTEQLKRAQRPPQILSETGCWWRDGQTLVLQTLKSNGVPVESDDPIYRNQYGIQSESGSQLKLAGPDGAITARRMADSYKLPVF